MNAKTVQFHLPTKPLSLIDAINRAAAATGSMRYASMTEGADYNGHALQLDWNDYRSYYVLEYFWAGRVVISRGEAEPVLRAAKDEFARQGRGASLSISVREEDAPIARALGFVEGEEPKNANADWRFAEVHHALDLERRFGIPATAHLLAAKTKDEFESLNFPDRKKTVVAFGAAS